MRVNSQQVVNNQILFRPGMAAAHPMRVFTSTFSAGGLPVSEVTFAELARQVGYRTAFLGTLGSKHTSFIIIPPYLFSHTVLHSQAHTYNVQLLMIRQKYQDL